MNHNEDCITFSSLETSSLWNINVTVTCIYTSASVKEETKENLLAYPEHETVHPLPPKSLFLQPHLSCSTCLWVLWGERERGQGVKFILGHPIYCPWPTHGPIFLLVLLWPHSRFTYTQLPNPDLARSLHVFIPQAAGPPLKLSTEYITVPLKIFIFKVWVFHKWVMKAICLISADLKKISWVPWVCYEIT